MKAAVRSCACSKPPHTTIFVLLACASAHGGVIGGKVIHSISGEPVRGVSLTLRSERGATRATTESDSGGKFRFEQIAAGKYELIGIKTGFIRRHYGPRNVEGSMGGTLLVLAADEEMTNLEFALTPQASISGKVVDESGDPVMRVYVVPYRRGGLGTPVHSMHATDDAGQFRLAHLPPGKYVVRVHQIAESPSRSPDDSLEEAFVPTYYPGVTEESQAAVLDAAPGQEISGVQIQLRRSRVFRVRGRLTGVEPAILESPMRPGVALLPRQSRPSMITVAGNSALVKSDGSFELFNVPPGSYNLVATDPSAGPFSGPIGRTMVEVAGQSLDSIVVHTGGSVTISGAIKVEGNPKIRVHSTVRLISEAMGMAVNPSGSVLEGNRFRIERLSRDRYFVELSPLPDGMYLKSVHAIDLTAGDAVVDLLLSLKAGSISGKVLDAGEPFAGAGVVIVPDPFTGIPAVTARTTSTDQQGRYELPNLAPGDYLLYAIEEPVSTMYLDASVLEPYRKSVKKVRISESARESIDLHFAKLEAR